ncbi:MAG TPA: glutamate-cysteine ligase family protein [Blastocatellia bacterium]|jgi:glutamate--cysteine ligase|nr:glutamate-cysteine ligase family protein [Blastocatellia bacterium]
MSLKPVTPLTPIDPADAITPASDFTHFFVSAAKPASRWAVGAEVELFGFTRDELARIDSGQVQAIIKGFSPQIISRVMENGFVTEAVLGTEGLSPGVESSVITGSGFERTDLSHPAPGPAPQARASGRLTLEPGGQIEFSGEPFSALRETERVLGDYLKRLAAIAEANGIIIIAAGFDPVRGIEEQKWIPKGRYEIMRPYLARRGRRAWDMMCRTAAIQFNFDYADLCDLAKKFTLANRLGPVAAAIFANSPFEQGKLSGYRSTRYATWLETDGDRAGPSPLALEDDFSIERFITYVRSVPMFFIRRGDRHINFAGRSFDDFVTNGADPIFQDFTDHLSTIFTEARLKPHVEQRSMDCCSLEMTMAALAFWKGLMYSADSLDRAIALVPKLSRDEFASLQLEVARHGLEARVRATTVIALAAASIDLARAGLESIAPDEAHYLDVLEERVTRERISPADILIRNYKGRWNGDIRKAVEYLAVAGRGDS